MNNEELSISDLARITGTQRRTIRSYIALGLLRGPDTVGRNASYGRHHLDRLRAIRWLRDQERLGLPEIRLRLQTLGDEDIASLANRLLGTDSLAPNEGRESKTASALEYIRALRASLKLEQEPASAEGIIDDEITRATTPPEVTDAETRVERGKSSDSRPATASGLWRRNRAVSHQSSLSTSPPARFFAGLEEPDMLRSAEGLLETRSADLEGFARAAFELRTELSRRDELLAHQLKDLNGAIHDLRAQTADFRKHESELRGRLASTQAELERLRHAHEPTVIAAVGPANLATDPGTPPRIDTFVRISILTDVEILIRGVPDGEKLKRIQRHAENLRIALLEDGGYDR